MLQIRIELSLGDNALQIALAYQIEQSFAVVF